MSSTAHSGASASNGPDHTPTFLGLPAELRNAIYEYTFAAETKSRLTPHPMTHVNRQTRRESLTMYYKSVTYLKLPLDTLGQIACARKWLAEFDFKEYPVLPTIELWPSDINHERIYFPREERCPAQEVPDYLAHVSEAPRQLRPALTDPRLYDAAVSVLYEAYLGNIMVKVKSMKRKAPEHFAQVVKKGQTWITRRMHDDEDGAAEWSFTSNASGFPSSLETLHRIAVRNGGRDWDKSDLEEIVKGAEDDILSRGQETD